MKFHRDGSLPTKGEIFVFGSNLRGIHKASGALVALREFEADFGNPVGLQGRSYAIPTKDRSIQTLSLEVIEPYIRAFISFSLDNPNKEFFITRVGCGLAGYQNKDIAPMFKECGENCSFPEPWKPYLLKGSTVDSDEEMNYLSSLLNRSL